MNAVKYHKLSNFEMAKLTGGAKKWIKTSEDVLKSQCIQQDENGNCMVVWVSTRETWQKVNSKGEILKTEYRPD